MQFDIVQGHWSLMRLIRMFLLLQLIFVVRPLSILMWRILHWRVTDTKWTECYLCSGRPIGRVVQRHLMRRRLVRVISATGCGQLDSN